MIMIVTINNNNDNNNYHVHVCLNKAYKRIFVNANSGKGRGYRLTI